MTAITAPRLDAGERITFLLADDHALVRDGLKLLVWAARPAVRFVESADAIALMKACLLYTSPSPRDGLLSRMPSSA